MAQQRFRCHQDQRLAVIAVQLTAQDVEVVRRGCTVRNDPVVTTTHLQEAFQTGRGMFRALAFEPMRKQDNKTRHAQPFAFAGADELVKHDLGTIGEIAELCFPHHQRIWFCKGITIFKAQHCIFRQHGVDDFVMGLTFADVVERIVTLFRVLVHNSGMTVRECPACRILTGQTHRVTFGQKGTKCQGFASGPVNAFALSQGFGFGIQHPGNGFMGWVSFRNSGQRGADFLKGFILNGCGTTLVVVIFGIKMGPAAIQPVSFVWLIFFPGLKFLIQMGLEGGFHILDLTLRDQTVFHQTFGIQLQRGLMAFDVLIHQRVGEHRFIALIVAKAAVAEDIQNNVFVELLAEFCCNAGRMHNRFRIITVHVEDRRFDHQGDVGWIGG